MDLIKGFDEWGGGGAGMGRDRKLTGTELLLIGLYLVSFAFMVYCYLVLIPKFSAIEWERRFQNCRESGFIN